MTYSIYRGVERDQSKAKKAKLYAFGVAGALALTVGFSVPTFAASAGDGSRASACGAAHGAYADVNGNFGFLGQDGGAAGYHDGNVGQAPGATGYNNSHTDCQQQ